jgi:hypothetical protein
MPGTQGIPGNPGNQGNSQGGGMTGFGTTAPAGAGGTPGSQAGAQTAAAAMIGNLLTQPRPGGMPTSMPGATIGGGIAGVASKFEAEGIMVINQRTAINEWEYIFDISKYRPPLNPISATAGLRRRSPVSILSRGTTHPPRSVPIRLPGLAPPPPLAALPDTSRLRVPPNPRRGYS